jgi:hypothetical protein
MEIANSMTIFMRHRFLAIDMQADKVGAWAPFFVAFILLSIAGWGIWSTPPHEGSIETSSNEYLPRFVEHFPSDYSNDIPNDDVIRMAWHPEESDLGVGKTAARYTELGELQTVDHPSIPANAMLHTTVAWTSQNMFNITVEINISSQIENGMLRIILIENDVEMFGRTPIQQAVVRLYDPTPIGEGNGTINRELGLTNGLTINDASRLQLVVLLSDWMTEENHALLVSDLPIDDSGPSETGQRMSTLMGVGVIALALAAIVRAEWKREVFLPKLRGSRNREGEPIAYLRIGLRDVKIREVRVLPPWKLVRGIRDIELPAGTDKTIPVRVKLEKGHEDVNTRIIETEWSIEVDEMGAWVLDLTLYKEPAT